VKKNRLEFLKKLTDLVFGFISLKLKKPNRTQTEKNQAEPGKNRAKLNQTKTG
jgi:hypothetical protein